MEVDVLEPSGPVVENRTVKPDAIATIAVKLVPLSVAVDAATYALVTVLIRVKLPPRFPAV